MFKISIAFYKKNHVCWESIMDFLREPYSIYLVCPRKHGSSSTVYFSLPNKRVNRITVLPRAIFKKLNCPRLNNCLSYDTFNFLKRGVIKLSSWTINKYEM